MKKKSVSLKFLIQVSGPLMVYAFFEVSVAHSLDYLIDFFASTVSSLYILESPTNSFSAGEQQSIYFLLWVKYTLSKVYPWWYMNILSSTELRRFKDDYVFGFNQSRDICLEGCIKFFSLFLAIVILFEDLFNFHTL